MINILNTDINNRNQWIKEILALAISLAAYIVSMNTACPLGSQELAYRATLVPLSTMAAVASQTSTAEMVSSD